MIDPKLNEIPVNTSDELLTEEQRAARTTSKPRAGLSINDTIAGTSNLSVGSRGVDTSGVAAGAGAGAGMTNLTPGSSAESPSPTIVPGARGSGTTVRGASDKLPPTSAMPDSSETTAASYQGSETGYSDSELAAEAHRCWQERGCPEGSPEVDWHTARERLRTRKAGV